MDTQNTSNIYYVYGLFRPDNSIFYVGKGKGNRMNQHSQIARCGSHTNKHLQSTILKVERNGGAVLCKKLYSNLLETEAHKIEQELIKQYGRTDKKTGVLVNKTDGGEGSAGFVMSDADREKIRIRMTGKPGLRRGLTHTDEAKEKLRAARALQVSPMFSRNHTEESKTKMSESRKGQPTWNKGIKAEGKELEKINAMNDRWRGSKQTPEIIEKIKAASLARWQDPEFREKRSASLKASWARRKAEASW